MQPQRVHFRGRQAAREADLEVAVVAMSHPMTAISGIDGIGVRADVERRVVQRPHEHPTMPKAM